MRNLILAFGLFFLSAVTAMAAPSQPSTSSCKIASSATSFVATGCTAAERKLIQVAQSKPTTKQVNASLQQLAGKEYLVINTTCKLKGGRRKATRRLVERCYRRAGEGQRLILGNALDNLRDIKACKGIKVLGKQVNCMIDQNNRLLLPLIEQTLDAHEAYMKGVKFMLDRGCTLKGGKLKCADGTGLLFAAVFMFLLGRLRPQFRIIIGIVAMIIGMVNIAKAEPCVNQAWHMTAPAQMLECDMVFSTPEANRKYTVAALNKAQHEICAAVPSAEMMQCFDRYYNAEKLFKERVGLLILKGYQKMADDMYPRPLSPCPKSFSEELCKSVRWPQEAGFGHIGGIFLILFTLLWGRGLTSFVLANEENKGTNRPFDGMWAACRTMILAAVGIIIVLAAGGAYGACTEAEIATNKVTAQYGFLRYDCDKDEVPQAKKDAIFEVVWRGFVAKGGLKMGMSKPYVYTRWQRLESVFFKVWGDAPLWQAKIAVAICTKEYVCGVSTKFSEWEGKRWESRKNDNGSVDCGITQINSDSTDKSCDELQDYETAFREQRRILMEKIKSEKKSVWKKRVFRYNGSGKSAREYGATIWEWSGASFGWVALMALFGRRRKGKGQGVVGAETFGRLAEKKLSNTKSRQLDKFRS